MRPWLENTETPRLHCKMLGKNLTNMVADDDDLDQAEADHLDEVMDAYYNEWEDQNEYDKNHN